MDRFKQRLNRLDSDDTDNLAVGFDFDKRVWTR